MTIPVSPSQSAVRMPSKPRDTSKLGRNTMSGPSEWTSKGRPMSTVALNFSAALDDLFKLGTLGSLEETVEQKNREVQTQRSQLEELDARIRETDERLKKLEQKHKRMSRHFSTRPSVQRFFKPNDNSDTDETEASSPGSEVPETGQR